MSRNLANSKKVACGCIVITAAFLITTGTVTYATPPGNDGTTVSGTVHVVKTRVKTSGDKSEKHIVVYLEPKNKEVKPASDTTVTMDQKGLVFVPHVMAVQQGTTVKFLNSDNENHNVFCVDDCCKILEKSGGGMTKFMDLGSWGQGESKDYTFNIPGVGVLLCKLHPEMAAYIVVLDTPYFTTAEIDDETQSASFNFKNIPPGDYVLKTWNKKCVSEDMDVTVPDGGLSDMNVEITRKQRRR